MAGLRLRQLGAIYFVAPTRASLRRIFNDFHKRRSIRMYSEAWLFFTRAAPEPLFKLVQEEIDRNEGFRNAVMLCRELNLEYVPVERQVFSLDMPEYFFQTYRHRNIDEIVGVEDHYDRIVERLFHLCISLGEFPEIAYFDMEPTASPGQQHLNDWLRVSQQLQTDVSKVAAELRDKLSHFNQAEKAAKLNAEMRSVFRDSFGVKKVLKGSEASSLLVLMDRSVDPVAPLLHDLFYEALVHDVVPVTSFGEVEFSYTNEKGQSMHKSVPLADPADSIWAHCKYMHLADFLNEINRSWSEFQLEFSEFFPGSSDRANPSNIKARLERMTEFSEKHAQFSKHIDLQSKLTQALEERALQRVCEMEMLMIFGRDVWDKAVAPSEILSGISNLLREAALRDEDKMRLLLIYYISVGSSAVDEDTPEASLRSDFHGLKSQAFAQGVPAQFTSIMQHLENHGLLTHLDTCVRRSGQGEKKNVTYGYGKCRRRYTTEPSGDEFNPQRSKSRPGLLERLAGHKGEVEISLRDTLSRFEPTMYWLLKDLAKGERNPNASYWCGLTKEAGAPATRDFCIDQLEWLGHEKAKQRTHSHRRASKVGAQRTIIICILGGVTHAEIRAAASLERRTGCKVLIGGTEVLSPQTYLQRMSMQGAWTQVIDDPEPPKYNPKEDIAAAAAAAAEGQPVGCVESCLDGLLSRLPVSIKRAMCCDNEASISRPMNATNTPFSQHQQCDDANPRDETILPSNP